MLAALLAASCTESPETALEVQPSAVASSEAIPDTRAWFNFPAGVLVGWEAQTGLRPASQAPGSPPPEDVWQSRIRAACDAPIWEQVGAQRLAEQYVAEDGGNTESVRLLEDAAESLWLIAVQVCREDFPQEAIERGPRFAFSP